MEKKLAELTAAYKAEIDRAQSRKELFDIRVKALGKSGELTGILKNLKDIPPEQRPVVGKIINDAKDALDAEILAKDAELYNKELNERLAKECIDITIEKKSILFGKAHPLYVTCDRITDFFVGLGFSVTESPEIEYAKFNFDRLNIPLDHPSRDPQDTFYINDEILLRTQTSPGQIRVMEKIKPPIKIISPGRVYRPDEVDATHTPCFHQMEGLVIDKGITMSDLKGILERFAKNFFSLDTKVRLRPSYFPFTEPSVEVDASCRSCGGSGCRICKGTGWIEILGAGMVNRKVLSDSGIDPDVYSGYAFGFGLDRITSIIHGITDARLAFDGDVRFLKQF